MSEINEHCQCDNCSGWDCGQDDPDRYLEQKIQDEEKHDENVRKAERERINNELDYIEHVSNIHEYDVTVYLKDVRKIVRGE